MNNVSLVGRLTKDLELSFLTNGNAYTRFTLAVNRRFKKEGQPEADFINCVAWGKTAEIMVEHLFKGSQIGVNGRIQTGSYENKEGVRIYTTDIVVENFDFLEKKNDNNKSVNAGECSNNSSTNAGYSQIESDDIPF